MRSGICISILAVTRKGATWDLVDGRQAAKGKDANGGGWTKDTGREC